MNSGLFLGQCGLELVNYLPGSLGPRQRMKAERQISFAGGEAANAAIAFCAFGNAASLVTALGGHPLAEVARTDIIEHGVTLVDLDASSKRPPPVGTVLADLEHHEYSVAYANTRTRKPRPARLDETLHDADIVLLDGSYHLQAREAAQAAKRRGIPVVLVGGCWKDELKTLLPLADYLIVSRDFRPPGCAFRRALPRELAALGVPRIAMTRGPDPILAVVEGHAREIPVRPVRVLDPLNAGAILHGAFCHFILERDFYSALEAAGTVASFSCTSLGPRHWMEQLKTLRFPPPLRQDRRAPHAPFAPLQAPGSSTRTSTYPSAVP